MATRWKFPWSWREHTQHQRTRGRFAVPAPLMSRALRGGREHYEVPPPLHVSSNRALVGPARTPEAPTRVTLAPRAVGVHLGRQRNRRQRAVVRAPVSIRPRRRLEDERRR